MDWYSMDWYSMDWIIWTDIDFIDFLGIIKINYRSVFHKIIQSVWCRDLTRSHCFSCKPFSWEMCRHKVWAGTRMGPNPRKPQVRPQARWAGGLECGSRPGRRKSPNPRQPRPGRRQLSGPTPAPGPMVFMQNCGHADPIIGNIMNSAGHAKPGRVMHCQSSHVYK